MTRISCAPPIGSASIACCGVGYWQAGSGPTVAITASAPGGAPSASRQANSVGRCDIVQFLEGPASRNAACGKTPPREWNDSARAVLARRGAVAQQVGRRQRRERTARSLARGGGIAVPEPCERLGPHERGFGAPRVRGREILVPDAAHRIE